ncbi:MAG: hypothetical protein ACHREM_06420 [Polyangiales bacterium]
MPMKPNDAWTERSLTRWKAPIHEWFEVLDEYDALYKTNRP